MIETSLSKVKINEIIQSQIPEYISVDNPLFEKFLKQYYYSQEYQGGSVDIADNLVDYKSLDFLNSTNLTGFTSLTQYISGVDETIYVESTKGWPNSWGLLKIDDEIITYTGIGTTSFTGCVRGFSGIDANVKSGTPEHLNFASTGIATHGENSRVLNLSNIFLNEFLKKLKTQILPGFQKRNLNGNIDQSNFIRQAKDFYRSKGTEASFKILFKTLYGKDVEMIQPQVYMIRPSDADWIVNDVIVAELISGDPTKIEGQTLFQDTVPIRTTGSIYNVEKAIISNNEYYKISISKGTTVGKFEQSGKTHLTQSSGIGATILNVDSTIGFGKTGNLLHNNIQYYYADKNYTQFLGVSTNTNGILESIGIGSIVTSSGIEAYSYEDGNLENLVSFNIVGSISKFVGSGLNQEVGAEINVSQVGIDQQRNEFSSWIYNTAVSYAADSIISRGSNIYEYKLSSDHSLYSLDKVSIIDSDGIEIEGTIVDIISNNKILISSQAIDIEKKYRVRRKIKTNKNFTADVQNAYAVGSDVYIASNSLPHWEINASIRNRSFTNSGIITTTAEIELEGHNFRDGDLVIYRGDGLSGLTTNQSYYVKRIDDEKLYLAQSLENIRRGRYIDVFGSSDIDSLGITTHTLTPENVGFTTVGAQRMLRKFSKPEYASSKTKTLQGGVGLFDNGVEIYSYKSTDKVFYGYIDSISVLNSGSNYDVINPPRLSITQEGHIGLGASAVCHVVGEIKEILVTSEGLDYINKPSVKITGGSGTALAEAKMKLVHHEVNFDSSSVGGIVDTSTDILTFKNAHGFKNGEEVIYTSNSTTEIGIGTTPGKLVDSAPYFIIKKSDYQISLAETKNNALSGINTIDIISSGGGVQKLKTKNRRLKVDKVLIINNDTFANRENTVQPNKVNFYTDTINIPNHGYNSGEKLVYSTTDTVIGGLSTTSNYYAIKIDDDNFRVSISTSFTDYVDLTSSGVGTHTFNYPPIEISISGQQGITTANATASPIVRGIIDNVHVVNSGSNFGSTVINDNFRPDVRIINGSQSLLEPIIDNGQISSIIVKSGGKDFFNTPEIIISGSGLGAKAKAVISNGEIIRVDIIDSGAGYDYQNTVVTAKTPGQDALFASNLNTWTVNQVSRYVNLNDVGDDDGFYESERIDGYGNPYVNYYVPRKLREFKNDNGIFHSPILGYAYDGSPIYGPYGFSNPDGTGGFKYLRPSYNLISGSRDGGPNLSDYPAGFFVEDYTYLENSGDLDEYNGRFAVTPEYPFGIYAYFSTVSANIVNSAESPFFGSREPLFPYVIGDEYNFKPSEFNFDFNSTQDLDISEYGAVRNTDPYNISEYEFITNSNKNTIKNSQITNLTNGDIESLQIIEPGGSYNVGDKISFDNTGTGGFGAIAEVSKVVGVAVTEITSSITTLEDVDLVVRGNTVTAISTVPHGLSNGVYVSIIGIGSTAFNAVTGTYQINVDTLRSGLSTSMTADGMTTSVTIRDFVTKFDVDDVLQIDDEQFVVMNLDIPNNKIRLLRNHNGTSGAAHTNGAEITRLEKIFDYQLPKVVSLSSPQDRIHYFDAEKSVGVGLSYGVGIGTTISYIGAGNSTKTKFIPTRTLYLPGHPFTNGEEVEYSPGAGTSLTVSTDGSNEHPIFKNVFIQKISDELVGIVSTKVGINSDLSRLFFNGNIGIGNSHFFRTKRDVISCDVRTVDVVVSTGTSLHNLKVGDTVDFSVVSAATSSVTSSWSNSSKFISIGSSVNPKINVTIGDTLEIDTSSSTLVNTELKLFTDPNFLQEFVGSGSSTIEISNQFSPGITSAKTSIHFTENLPRILYYKFVPTIKTKIIEIDKNIEQHSKIIVNDSKFAKSSHITTATDYSFTYNIFEIPERVGYTSDSYIRYITNSNNVNGPIAKVSVIDGGKQYNYIPKVSIASTTGTSALLRPFGSNIGSIDSNRILEFGYDYPSDITLQPQAKIPQIIFLKNNLNIDSVGVTSAGSGYLTPPDLILYNKVTDTVFNGIDLIANMNGVSVESVSIKNSGRNLSTNDDSIIAVNNSNGVGIISATYSNPNVTLRLQTPTTGFSTENPLPFTIGDKVFVENVGVSTGNGYNSSDYAYSYFTIAGVNTAFGLVDQATISYSVSKDPGIHDGLKYGTVSKEQDLAKFSVRLSEKEFFPGEDIISNNYNSKIISGIKNPTDILKVDTIVGLNTGDIITGKVSGASGEVQDINGYNAHFEVDSAVSKNFGWETDTGKLNNSFQRIQDSDYYQTFSYSLKSEVGISSWSEAVDSLAHISGFKKHSDLLIPSDSLAGLGSTSVFTGIGSQQSTIILTEGPTKLYCKNDWDLVYEITAQNESISDEVVFQSNRFGEALICSGNRVLDIDDISPDFYDDPDVSRTVEIDSFEITDTSAVKYYAQIVLDTDSGVVFNEAQYCEFTVSHDGESAIVNQYSDISDAFDLGDFYAEIDGNTVQVLFSPYNSSFTFDITLYREVIGNEVGVGSTSFGHVVRQGVTSYISPSVSPTTHIIQSIDAEKFKSGTAVISVIGEGEKTISESTFLGIGTTALYSNFAQMDADVGLGTFSVGMTNTNDLQLKFLPLAGYGLTVSILATLVGVATTSANTGIPGTSREIGDASIQCTRTEISASSSPSAETIATATGNSYTSVKYIIQVENTTDNEYSFYHVAANVYNGDVNYIKYNNVSTATTETRDIENTDMISSGSNGILRFTPQQNKSYIIRTSEILIDKPDSVTSDVSIIF